MMPTSRCLSSLTRTRVLLAASRSSGSSLESLKIDQSETVVPERIASSSRAPDWPDSSETWRHTDHSLLARSAPRLLLASQQARGFHASSCVPYSAPYHVVDVPDFFVKYKQHRIASLDSGVCERKHEEPGLLRPLTTSILSGATVATTRSVEAKIPVEHHAGEGRIVHPSGFVVPGPGHTSTSDVARAKERTRNEDRDRLVQTAAVAHSVLESDFEPVAATTLPAFHKVPVEVREPDGTVKHPSGFVPPTPAHKFKHTVNSGAVWERKVSAVRQKLRQPSPSLAG